MMSQNYKLIKLKDWLTAIFDEKSSKKLIDYQFLSDRHRSTYLRSIGSRSEEEVKKLLRKFLISSGSLGIDQSHLPSVLMRLKTGIPLTELDRRRLQSALSKGQILPWEGITWVIDLLPCNPRLAIETIDAYWIAHCQALPDGRLFGLQDAIALIRGKYILHGDVKNVEKILDTISWREFECLTAKLFSEMGYSAKLTSSGRDGGRDVIINRRKRGFSEVGLIQCKKYSEAVGVEIIRELLGVVSSEKANRGIVVTTSRFTYDAKKFAKKNNIELIDGKKLKLLLNEYIGANWPSQFSRIVEESPRLYG